MKKGLGLVLALLVALLPLAGMAEGVSMTLGSWRADDVEQMNNLLSIYKEKTGVDITFQPIDPPQYNATLRVQLDGGIGPDLMYSRSYATGLELFEAGHSGDCTDIPGLKENFSATSLQPWETADGKMYAVPFASVSHGVYYNKDIFAANNLEVPATFEEFLTVCETLKAAGITPLANGIADQWDILECLFCGMLPNYIGGAESRAKYETGETPMNDENMLAAWNDVAKLAPYLPSGFEAVTYNDSQILFATGKAAMFVDGSWSAGIYDDVDFEWTVFAIPAPEGRETAICFHPDLAITYNTAGANVEAAKAFLAWLCTEEGVTAASANLPKGYFPLANFSITLDDPHVNDFLKLNEGRVTDARFVFPVLSQLYNPMLNAVNLVLTGDLTPDAAADQMVEQYNTLYGAK